jgi:hypothetical protein
MSRTSDFHRRCLLLNADFSPLRIIDWQKAIVWSIRYENDTNYGIEILSYYDKIVINGTSGKQYSVPCVARSKTFLNLYNKKIHFSKNRLLIRDNYTCQYCGIRLPPAQLTLDHVIPRSRINDQVKTDWMNIVASCRKCNAKKGNKTPQEANMNILTQPTKPVFSSKYLPMFKNLSIIHKEWEPYLPELAVYEN